MAPGMLVVGRANLMKKRHRRVRQSSATHHRLLRQRLLRSQDHRELLRARQPLRDFQGDRREC